MKECDFFFLFGGGGQNIMQPHYYIIALLQQHYYLFYILHIFREDQDPQPQIYGPESNNGNPGNSPQLDGRDGEQRAPGLRC